MAKPWWKRQWKHIRGELKWEAFSGIARWLYEHPLVRWAVRVLVIALLALWTWLKGQTVDVWILMSLVAVIWFIVTMAALQWLRVTVERLSSTDRGSGENKMVFARSLPQEYGSGSRAELSAEERIVTKKLTDETWMLRSLLRHLILVGRPERVDSPALSKKILNLEDAIQRAQELELVFVRDGMLDIPEPYRPAIKAVIFKLSEPSL